jgi:hypothetical protein
VSPLRKRFLAALAFALPAAALVATPVMAKQQAPQSQSQKAKGTHASSKSKSKTAHKSSKPKKPVSNQS